MNSIPGFSSPEITGDPVPKLGQILKTGLNSMIAQLKAQSIYTWLCDETFHTLILDGVADAWDYLQSPVHGYDPYPTSYDKNHLKSEAGIVYDLEIVKAFLAFLPI